MKKNRQEPRFSGSANLSVWFCILLGAQSGNYTSFAVLEMLEYSAMGAMSAIAASLLMEYILREQTK